MRVKRMSPDQYKLSIEALPLQVLYSKYNAGDANSSLQVVRPLGRVRKERRPSSECPNKTKPNQRSGTHEHGQRSDRRACISEIKMPRQFDTDKNKLRRSHQNLSALEHRDKDSPLPSLSRSKTQEFEHRFRIAASRGQGQESPTPRHSSRDYNKKVVHLPLFRINLKTFTGETETSKAVASTRESLKELMEIHKSKMKPANVTTANIKNYEFHGPQFANGSACKHDGAPNGILVSQSFPAKPVLKSSTRVRESHKTAVNKKKQFRFELSDNKQFNAEVDSKSSCSEHGESPTDKSINKYRLDELDPDDEPDDSMLSIAIRPDTSLTLGSTMHQLDRVIKSPGSDELRELSEVFRNTDSQPAWPSYDDVQKMRLYAQSRSRRSRPSTVLRDVLDTPLEGYRTPRSRPMTRCEAHGDQWGGPKPVLRYTSKSSHYKLDPIIVPSHTCTECPMCNIYQKEVETPCPPNTPMSSQLADSQYILGNRELATTPYQGGRRDVRMHGKQEVLHLSRINMNGSNTPSEEQNILTYMKAKG